MWWRSGEFEVFTDMGSISAEACDSAVSDVRERHVKCAAYGGVLTRGNRANVFLFLLVKVTSRLRDCGPVW